MGLTITDRPSKQVNGSTSSWNAINLPIQYKFDSDLFPFNNVDPLLTITGWSNDNGFLRITTSATATNILTNEVVFIKDSDIDSYNGIFKVKTVHSTSDFTLNVSYDGIGTLGTIQKYYNNYFVEVRVYGGLPASHGGNVDKPFELLGTLRVIPNPDNTIVASFSGVLKSNVSMTNNVNDGIDLDHFTGFYIEYREAYDVSVNGEIDTFYDDWEIDSYSNCGNDEINNGNFDSDLSGWSQQNPDTAGIDFTWDSGTALVELPSSATKDYSKIIYQEVNIVPSVTYLFTMDVTRSGPSFANCADLSLVGFNDDLEYNTIYFDPNTSCFDQSYSIPLTVSNQYKYIGILFNSSIYNTNYVDVTIDNVSFTAQECSLVYWASNSSLQFQNIRGGNMYDYVIGKSDAPNFLTYFKEPRMFRGYEFNLSALIDANVSAVFDISSTAKMWFNGDDLESDGSNIDSWIDRCGNAVLTAAASTRPTVIDSGVNGNKGALFDGLDDFMQFSNISEIPQPFTVYMSMSINNDSYQCGLIGDNFNFLASLNIDLSIYAGQNISGSYPLNSDDHVIKMVFNDFESVIYLDNERIASGTAGTGSFVGPSNLLGRVSALGSLDGVISEVIVIDDTIDDCTVWKIENYLGDKYDTYNTTSLGYTKQEYKGVDLISTSNNFIDYKGAGIYRIPVEEDSSDIDSLDVKVISTGDCELSNTLKINVDDPCGENPIYIKWLNPLAGWDYWLFTAEKDYLLNIDSKDIVERDIYNNWDSTFINGDTEYDVIKANAYETIDVYSQYLTLDELKAISVIKYSVKVLALVKEKWVTVIVDSDTLQVYNDGDENTLHTIRFTIRLPKIQIQSQ